MTADSTPTSLPAHIQLAGLGLILREWADGDLPVMVELFDGPSGRPLDPAAFTLRPDRRTRLPGQGPPRSRRGPSSPTCHHHRRVPPKGEILLARTGDHDSDAELAYAIGPLHRRQRLATRAVQLRFQFSATPAREPNGVSTARTSTGNRPRLLIMFHTETVKFGAA
jgi:hypothetical protein